jgi:hypothetical protein
MQVIYNYIPETNAFIVYTVLDAFLHVQFMLHIMVFVKYILFILHFGTLLYNLVESMLCKQVGLGFDFQCCHWNFSLT